MIPAAPPVHPNGVVKATLASKALVMLTVLVAIQPVALSRICTSYAPATKLPNTLLP